MNDYIDNLVARNCERLAVVRPRPLSQFEPVLGSTWSTSKRHDAPNLVESESVSHENPPSALAKTWPAARYSPSSPHAAEIGMEQEYPGIPSTHPNEQVGQHETQSAPTNVNVLTKDMPKESVEVIVRPSDELAIERVITERTAKVTTPSQLRIVSINSESETQAKDRVTEGHTGIKAIVARPVSSKSTLGITHQFKTGYFETVPPPTSSAAKTIPAIQVNIGRIEVRATAAPVQKKPEPKSPAPMSLEEYLNRRSGGRR